MPTWTTRHKGLCQFRLTSRIFCQKRIFAIALDPPGTWESPGKDIFTTTNYIQATNELIAYLGNRETILLGHSRGGATAVLLAEKNPAISGIVLVIAALGPPSKPNPKKISGNYLIEKRDLVPGDRATTEKYIFPLSLEYFLDGEQYDPVPILKTYTKPKLIIYATHDQYEDPNDVRDIIAKLPPPVSSFELPCDHDYRYYPEMIEAVNTQIGEFLDKYFAK